MYTVFWTSGERDGETLGKFQSKDEAIKFAEEYHREHESEFDPVCGGVGIVDGDGNPVEW